jgi:hypothetical protein
MRKELPDLFGNLKEIGMFNIICVSWFLAIFFNMVRYQVGFHQWKRSLP